MQKFGGKWSKDKLDAIEKYLSFYTTALKKTYFQTVYIDAFAGSGEFALSADEDIDGSNCPLDDSNPLLDMFDQASLAGADIITDEEQAKEETIEIYKGSVRRSLEIDNCFDKYHFIEKKRNNCSKLNELKQEYARYSDKISVHQGDANTILQDLLPSVDWHTHRGVIFLDPFGMEVEWSTLQCIAKTGALDLWYLFPFSGAIRHLRRDGKFTEEWKSRLDKLFGTEDWYDFFYQEPSQPTLFDDSPDKQRPDKQREVTQKRVLEYSIDRLKSIFQYVSPKSKVLYNSRNNTPLFLLCFAVSNKSPKAIDLAKKVANHI